VASANAVDVDLALDNQGRPHVVFTGLVSGDVTYARRVDKVWTTETVDAGRRAAVTIDGDGAIHAGYVRENGPNPGELHYAVRSGGDWTTELVDAGTASLSYTDVDIALHPDGYARLAGATVSDDYAVKPRVFYAQQTAVDWVVEPVPGTVGGWDRHDWCSLAVDAAGNAHVSFQFNYDPVNAGAEAQDYSYMHARYVENTTGVWRAWVLTPDAYYPEPSSLTVSPADGVAHVALSAFGGLWHVVIDDPARSGR
jgi:hypothetical protein